MEAALRAALIAWLRADPALKPRVNLVAEEAIARARPPWLALTASAAVDWSTKTRAGREIRVALELHSRADDPAADAGLIAAIERRVEALPRDHPGFALVNVHFLRGRTERRGDHRRASLIEYRFRLLAPQSPSSQSPLSE